ncbi:MAG: hypothetical protein JWO79_3520 [Actinomycetia bacterium]|nr:hypothetical protein [Actinomycetes bacterium]
MRRLVRSVAVALVLAASTGALQLVTGVAARAECHTGVIDTSTDENGGVVYIYGKVCDGKDGGAPGSGHSGGAPAATCRANPETRSFEEPSFCMGERLCWISHSMTQDSPGVELPGPKPAPPDKYVMRFCYLPLGKSGPPGGEWVLNSLVAAPPLAELALESFGSLRAPDAQIHTSPVSKAVVNLPTWFTLGEPAEVRGTEAGPLVAVATLDGTSWEPGSGSPFTCAAVAVLPGSQACAHTYDRSSAGHPPYTVTVTRTYKVHYEVNGAQQTIEGAPQEFIAPPASIPLAVTEIQTTVTSGH